MGKGKPAKNNLGRALTKPRKRDYTNKSTVHSIDDSEQHLSSITESNDLDEFLNSAVIADTEFIAEKQNVVILDKNAFALVHSEPTKKQIQEQAKNIDFLAIPRRPQWDAQTTAEELDQSEREAFLEWRRALVQVEENEHLVLTPFEKNLEVWRQLWRVVERSDIIVQIVDSRNPLLFFSSDLVKYVHEVNPKKQCILLLNKADLLTKTQRTLWMEYFVKHKIQFRFFSAKIEKQLLEEAQKKQNKEDGDEEEDVPPPEPVKPFNDKDLSEIMNCEQFIMYLEKVAASLKIVDRRMVVGMIGYPNVGKSSTINVLCQQKRVAESATPGKTKHFQTIMLNEQICLCDCPGLVFPSYVSTKADMVCNGLLPIDQMRDHVGPTSLVCQRIPRFVLEQLYGISLPAIGDFEEKSKPPSPHELLQTFGRARGFMASHGMPDEPRSSRFVLKDYVNGRLLYCHPPPNVDAASFNSENYKDFNVTNVRQYDSITDGLEEMQKAPPKEQLYQGKRKVRRRHHGEGQETVNVLTKGQKIAYGTRLPTKIRL